MYVLSQQYVVTDQYYVAQPYVAVPYVTQPIVTQPVLAQSYVASPKYVQSFIAPSTYLY